MKELIKHLLHENLNEIVNRSLLNCHIVGLHSIMLLESPGKTIRLYIASKDHQLTPGKLSIHAHHCNITLHQVHGMMINTSYSVGTTGHLYNKFSYKSAIKEGSMRIEKIGGELLKLKKINVLAKGNSIYLPAEELHTVECARGKESAWLVYEGKEDESYESVLYSMQDSFDTVDARLYLKTDADMILRLLKSVDLL